MREKAALAESIIIAEDDPTAKKNPLQLVSRPGPESASATHLRSLRLLTKHSRFGRCASRRIASGTGDPAPNECGRPSPSSTSMLSRLYVRFALMFSALISPRRRLQVMQRGLERNTPHQSWQAERLVTYTQDDEFFWSAHHLSRVSSALLTLFCCCCVWYRTSPTAAKPAPSVFDVDPYTGTNAEPYDGQLHSCVFASVRLTRCRSQRQSPPRCRNASGPR